MKKILIAAVVLGACASTAAPEPQCPKCYEIDEVAPYEPPRRVIILCDRPDASPDDYEDYRARDASDDDPFARVF